MTHPQALRVVVCDDEAPARSRMRELLEDCAATLPLELVGEAANGLELLALLQDREADLVLLDIRMPGMDGLEAAGHLAKLEDPPKVIFATAFDAHAVKAFELHAVDYLLKPIRLRRLFDALTRARALTPLRLDVLRDIAPEPRTHFSVPERGRVVLVPVPEILFLRAELKYVTIRTARGEHLLEESLTRLEQEFSTSFIRIHRSYLVAKRHLAGFERAGEASEGGWVALVKGLEEPLPVSRRQAHVVREFGRTLL
jgi:two-component system response regulator AlgR